MVEATVSIANLEEQLSSVGVALGKKTLPTILFFIAESKMDDAMPRYWWGADLPYFKATAENAISDIMQTKGFAILDPGDLVQVIGMDIENTQPDLDNQTAMDLAGRFGADVVVIGNSKVERTGNIMGTNIRSFRAVVDIRALVTQTGVKIASANQTAVTSNANELEGSNQALQDAGSLAGEVISEQIIYREIGVNAFFGGKLKNYFVLVFPGRYGISVKNRIRRQQRFLFRFFFQVHRMGYPQLYQHRVTGLPVMGDH